MIPRYQRIIYWSLVGGILLMVALLIRGCERNHDRIVAMRDRSPIAAPTDIATEDVSVALANDADGSVTLDQLSLALPEDPSLRARVLLERLLTDFSLPASTHPVPAGPAISDVFFVSLPLANNGATSFSYSRPSSPYSRTHAAGATLAVVNLTKTFCDAHPSGIETEDLTLRAIISTLHANFPQIEQVRFTVDGLPRDTLSGHADLSHTYGVADATKSIHILSPDGNPL
jgi:hypothetical protein